MDDGIGIPSGSNASGVVARQATALVPSVLLIALLVGICARNSCQRCAAQQRRAYEHGDAEDTPFAHHPLLQSQQRALLLDLRGLRQP